jgi:hypothetical protein
MATNTGATALPPTDMLYTFTGIRTDALLGGVRSLLSMRHPIEHKLIHLLTDNPLEANVAFLLASSAAFYQAEVGINPKINTFIDAVYYISTCLAVGYADIFAETQRGRAIAALVMLVGPALTAELLDPPNKAFSASEAGQDEMIGLLREILTELKNR